MVKTIQEWDPSFIRALKDREDEDKDYEQQFLNYKKSYPPVYGLNMFVIPVSFVKEHRKILAHCNEMMEYKMV
jgi:hypothetical protein